MTYATVSLSTLGFRDGNVWAVSPSHLSRLEMLGISMNHFGDPLIFI